MPILKDCSSYSLFQGFRASCFCPVSVDSWLPSLGFQKDKKTLGQLIEPRTIGKMSIMSADDHLPAVVSTMIPCFPPETK